MVKKEIKPLNAIRFDFVASLDKAFQEGIMLLTAVETAIRHGKVEGAVKEVLEERAKAFRKAYFEELKLED